MHVPNDENFGQYSTVITLMFAAKNNCHVLSTEICLQ